MKARVVLDANVFVSGILKPQSKPGLILDLVRNGQVRFILSTSILAEFERVLLYPKIRKYHQQGEQEIKGLLGALSQIATVTPGKLKVPVLQTDPDDTIYLVCAVEGKADFIVSGDHHLLDLASFQGIPIVTPDIFLRLMENYEK